MIRTARQTAPELPQAAVGGKRRFSLVWLIPIVAAIAGAWLVYTTFAERGPTITITFQSASGSSRARRRSSTGTSSSAWSRP